MSHSQGELPGPRIQVVPYQLLLATGADGAGSRLCVLDAGGEAGASGGMVASHWKGEQLTCFTVVGLAGIRDWIAAQVEAERAAASMRSGAGAVGGNAATPTGELDDEHKDEDDMSVVTLSPMHTGAAEWYVANHRNRRSNFGHDDKLCSSWTRLRARQPESGRVLVWDFRELLAAVSGRGGGSVATSGKGKGTTNKGNKKKAVVAVVENNPRQNVLDPLVPEVVPLHAPASEVVYSHPEPHMHENVKELAKALGLKTEKKRVQTGSQSPKTSPSGSPKVGARSGVTGGIQLGVGGLFGEHFGITPAKANSVPPAPSNILRPPAGAPQANVQTPTVQRPLSPSSLVRQTNLQTPGRSGGFGVVTAASAAKNAAPASSPRSLVAKPSAQPRGKAKTRAPKARPTTPKGRPVTPKAATPKEVALMKAPQPPPPAIGKSQAAAPKPKATKSKSAPSAKSSAKSSPRQTPKQEVAPSAESLMSSVVSVQRSSEADSAPGSSVRPGSSDRHLLLRPAEGLMTTAAAHAHETHAILPPEHGAEAFATAHAHMFTFREQLQKQKQQAALGLKTTQRPSSSTDVDENFRQLFQVPVEQRAVFDVDLAAWNGRGCHLLTSSPGLTNRGFPAPAGGGATGAASMTSASSSPKPAQYCQVMLKTEGLLAPAGVLHPDFLRTVRGRQDATTRSRSPSPGTVLLPRRRARLGVQVQQSLIRTSPAGQALMAKKAQTKSLALATLVTEERVAGNSNKPA
eukprot:g307.t1